MNNNDLLIHDLQNRISELEKSNESHKQTISLYQTILDKLPFGVQIFDKDGYSFRINAAQKEMLGLPGMDTGIGKFNVLTDPYSVANGVSRLFEEAYNGVQKSHELEYDLGNSVNQWETRKDKRTFKEFIIPIEDKNGEILNVVAILDDISEQKDYTEKLKESESRFGKIFYSSPIAIMISDLHDGTIIDVNDQWCELTQYSKSEAIGKHLDDIKLTEDSERLKIRDTLIRNGHLINFETRISSKEGQKKAISISCEIISINGKTLTIGLAKDLSKIEEQSQLLQEKNREIEEKLKELSQVNEDLLVAKKNIEINAAYFKSMVENTPYAIFIQTDWKFSFVNKHALQFFGAENEEELINKPILERFHPDYIALAENRIKNLNENQQSQSQIEICFLKIDGSPVYGEITGRPFRFQNSNGGLAIIKDNTEFKKAQEEVAQKTIEINTFFDCAVELLCIADTSGRFIRLNKEWENVLGYELSELENKLSLEFVHPDDLQSTLDVSNQLSDQVKILNFKNRFLCKNGEYKWLEWRSFPQGNRIYASARDITEKISYEEELIASKEQLRFAFEGSNDGLWDVNMKTNHAFLSQRGWEILGFSSGDTVDREKVWSELVHPDDLMITNERLSAYLNGESNLFEVEQRLRKKTGDWKWVLTRGKVVSSDSENLPLRMSGTHTDISDRKKAEVELLETRLKAEQYGRNFENIFSNSPIGIFVIDVEQNGKFVISASNPIHERMIGVQNGKLNGKPLEILSDMFGIETFQYIKNLYDKIIITRETLNIEESVILSNKTVRLSTTIRPIFDETGRIYRLIGTNLDITSLKDIENELIAAKEKAEQGDRLKSAFLQNISHEVRTPLNAIVGFSSIIAERMSNDQKLQSIAKMIAYSSDKLIGIIMDVIEISQIQTSQIEVKISDINLQNLITKVVNPFYDKAENAKIELELESDIDDKSTIISDEWKIERIIFHILDNAVKFTNQGSVKIQVELEDETLKIVVEDSGIGIDKEHQTYIFEPFRQVETDIHRNYGGLGLGLSLAKTYAELLNGNLSLTSENGKGTTVTIMLPTDAQKETQRKDNIKNYVALTKKSSAPNIILIAEDDLDSFLFLKEAFESGDVVILHANNGQIAVEMCELNSEIDLVLMDFKMPVMDGRTATKLIKQIRPDLPIIAQTAYTDEINNHSMFEYFDDYVVKPVKIDLLREKISNFLTL